MLRSPICKEDNLVKMASVQSNRGAQRAPVYLVDHQIILCVGAVNVVDPQLVKVYGAIPAHTQHFALPFIEFHGIPVNLVLQPDETYPHNSAIRTFISIGNTQLQ
ncbi:hypothetical protein WISP_21856 [Willisornis vidua]|uniref:Uncharacterized protein n=1 Tax=Willisornis vidua TaxID=1566151 RepID=A0ABQ9DPF6_9PASS|nr:hypothetical protein WISP_21856 [Willisornis vidua]